MFPLKFSLKIILLTTVLPLTLIAESNVTLAPIISYLLSNSQKTFTTGQSADLILSEAGFNNAGYLNSSGDGLLFNHLKGIDSDGTHLLVADSNNNRVLIWNTLPNGNRSPDIVLGQSNLIHNNSGSSLANMNWPTSVATDGTRIFVTDAYNDRVLVWNSFPTTNGVSADFEIINNDLRWPWGIWSDGNKLLVASTMNPNGSAVLVWNSVPTSNVPHDYAISSHGEMGTPRTITTDGSSFLIVGDHNQDRSEISSGQGSFYWKSFPTEDSSADYFLQDFSGDVNYAWLQGDITQNGELFLLARHLYKFNSLPTNATTSPDITFNNYEFVGGDGADIVAIDSDHDGSDDKLYISTYNGNKIVGYNAIPTSDEAPDFVIGSNDLNVNSLVEEHHYIENPTPACNQNALYVSSGFGRKLMVWSTLPTTDNQPPSFTINFEGTLENMQPNSLTLTSNKLLAYGKNEKKIFIWDPLPTSNTDLPAISYTDTIGNVTLGEDVTLDETYLYALNSNTLALWSVTDGLPAATDNPDFTITLSSSATKITTDGTYLSITYTFGHYVELYKIADIIASTSAATAYATIGGAGIFNLPESAITAGDKLYIADTIFNRVHVWNSIERAKNGAMADAILGQANTIDKNTKKSDDGLFWPAKMCSYGDDLWVGEYKFSGRLIKFSAH
jgi:hypothetical protein